MNFGAVGVVCVAVLLCGCSDADWDNALNFGHAGASDTAVAQTGSANAPPPVESASLPAPQVNMADATAGGPRPNWATQTITTTTTTVAPLDPTTGYCRTLARNAGATATRDGMDAPAQQQAADTIYAHCMSLFGGPVR
jgi:hypothetical protein